MDATDKQQYTTHLVMNSPRCGQAPVAVDRQAASELRFTKAGTCERANATRNTENDGRD